MIKRIGHIILAFLVLTATNGIAVSKHYCGNSLQSVSVLSSPESCCDSEEGCCHDETTFYQVDEDIVLSSATTEIEFINLELDILHYFEVPRYKQVQFNHAIICESPPGHKGVILSQIQSFLL